MTIYTVFFTFSDLALVDVNPDHDLVVHTGVHDLADRLRNAVCSDREVGGLGQCGIRPPHRLGELEKDSRTVRGNRGAGQRGRGGVGLHHDVEYVAHGGATVVGGHLHCHRLHIRSHRRALEGPRGGVEAQPRGQIRVVTLRRRVDQRVAAVGVGKRVRRELVAEIRAHRRRNGIHLADLLIHLRSRFWASDFRSWLAAIRARQSSESGCVATSRPACGSAVRRTGWVAASVDTRRPEPRCASRFRSERPPA